MVVRTITRASGRDPSGGMEPCSRPTPVAVQPERVAATRAWLARDAGEGDAGMARIGRPPGHDVPRRAYGHRSGHASTCDSTGLGVGVRRLAATGHADHRLARLLRDVR